MDNKKERGMEHRERMEMNTMRHDKKRMHPASCECVKCCELCWFTLDRM